MKKLLILVLLLSCQSFQKSKSIKGYFKVTAPSGLLLRKGPGQQYEKIANLPRGTNGNVVEFASDQLEISGSKGRWLEVYVNERVGFIFSGHVLYSNNSDTFVKRYNENVDIGSEIFPIHSFLNLPDRKDKILTKLKKGYEDFFTEKDKLDIKKIHSLPESDIFAVGFSSEYLPNTIYKKDPKINQINLPDEPNFHLRSLYEKGRLASGEIYICYGCCAMTEPSAAILGVQKSVTIYTSIEDTNAICVPEAGSLDYNRFRVSDVNNEIYIHQKQGDCSEAFLEKCLAKGGGAGCVPTKFVSDKFIVIKDPYVDPVFETYSEQGIPEAYRLKFNTARKAILYKKLAQ
ncbi:SH3 domain-containing protein [Leptospira licerasiae]|uniref:SH3 domain-containing protein n=1 Tax=Leptospira licerasiae TaxID=447106 RepID=UPI0010826B28|nr:SH3 domain-containing protein [Leptospira licerasiae]TGM89576.1 SH3 domain-containing protein [Leptospira licerasiae]